MITWRAFNQLFQHFIRICVLNTGKFVLFIILKFNTFYAGIILKTTCKLFSSRTVRNTPRTEMFNFINAIKGTRVINLRLLFTAIALYGFILFKCACFQWLGMIFELG